MFGDDPDPTVMTVRVGFGTISDAREGGCGLTREVRLDLAVGSGLCRRSRGKRREEREIPVTIFGDRKRPMLDRL